MRARRILLAMGLMLVPALILGGLACGSKKNNPVSTTGGGDPAPFRDGSWELRYTITATSGDPSCAEANGSFVDTFTVAAGEVSGFIGSNCTFAVSGTHFSQTCTDTYVYSATCHFVVTISGSGDGGGDTFTAAYTATVAPTGNCSLSPVSPCTATIAATGTRLPTLAGGVRVGSVPEGIARRVVGRVVGTEARPR
jgi:hypothetical protein